MPRTQVSHAEWVDSMPYPVIKPKGRAAEGYAFQRKVWGSLQKLSDYADLMYEPCIRYRDSKGTHYCQPDCVISLRDRVIVVEAKLSLRRYADARKQLLKRYRPTLSYLFQKPVFVLIAFRFWVPGDFKSMRLVKGPMELFTLPKADSLPVYGWHYLG